jgi:site-specific DNA-cytosine methylase
LIHTAYPGEVREYSEVSPTISTPSGGGHLPMVAQALQTDGQLRDGTSWDNNKPQSSRNIRRLTPTECERLQGFPDSWTKYGLFENGEVKEISDSQRYKCCGNAVTTNVIKDIASKWNEYTRTLQQTQQ